VPYRYAPCNVTHAVFGNARSKIVSRSHAARVELTAIDVSNRRRGARAPRFPIDTLKLDKTFVDGVARAGTDAALARAIIAFGDTLHLSTVAEGVEHAQQRDELLALGCKLAQGYLFARPLDASAIAPLQSCIPTEASAH
jgi:predicted signal transduction protein with EAL and GGDEF domain